MPVLDNPKHRRFAQEYVKSGNATRAYISMGYSKNGADASTARLLGNARVLELAAELQRTIAERMVKREISKCDGSCPVLGDMLGRMMRVIDARAELLEASESNLEHGSRR